MKYRNIVCGNVSGRRDSEKLPGALAADEDFFYIQTYKDEYGPEGVFLYDRVFAFVPKEIQLDFKNNIFIGSGGAVADAYDFSFLTEEEKESTMQEILAEKRMMYPTYDFAILPGQFPIDVQGGLVCAITDSSGFHEEQVRPDEGVMSSHVLYITDYQNHLTESKKKSL